MLTKKSDAHAELDNLDTALEQTGVFMHYTREGVVLSREWLEKRWRLQAARESGELQVIR